MSKKVHTNVSKENGGKEEDLPYSRTTTNNYKVLMELNNYLAIILRIIDSDKSHQRMLKLASNSLRKN